MNDQRFAEDSTTHRRPSHCAGRDHGVVRNYRLQATAMTPVVFACACAILTAALPMNARAGVFVRTQKRSPRAIELQATDAAQIFVRPGRVTVKLLGPGSKRWVKYIIPLAEGSSTPVKIGNMSVPHEAMLQTCKLLAGMSSTPAGKISIALPGKFGLGFGLKKTLSRFYGIEGGIKWKAQVAVEKKAIATNRKEWEQRIGSTEELTPGLVLSGGL